MTSDEQSQPERRAGQTKRIDELERDMSDVKSRLAITEERSRRVEDAINNLNSKIDAINQNLEHYIRDVERWKGGRDAVLKIVTWGLGGSGLIGVGTFAYTTIL